ncbi:type II secretion system F family protein [Chitiniphilus shinanonensis]|uniref:type II secretion system F family protein n=1 Tax=Chitiniphilus shinanonensis TaxID=553088 RepID=UPI0003814642|nr:type II secretion system F family protein [Chitiniphilus shinanonensis]
MPGYRYRALERDGTLRLGRLPATDLADLERQLARRALTLLRARRDLLPAARVGNRRERLAFTFHLEQMLAAGLPLLEALADLREQAESPHLAALAGQLHDRIEGGSTLSAALAEQGSSFDATYVALIRAGEHSGNLPEMLARLGAMLRWQDEVAAHTRTLLLYPAIVAVAVGGASAFLVGYLVPQMADFLRDLGGRLPWSTRALIALSDWLGAHGLALLGALAAAVLSLPLASRHAGLRQIWEALRLRLPWYGPLLHGLAMARFAQCLATLYRAGVPILSALDLAGAAAGNPTLGAALQRGGERLAAGQGLADSLGGERLFPPWVVRLLRLGEQTGQLDQALSHVAEWYRRRVGATIERAQALIAPALTVLLGGLLCWVMLAVLGPIFDAVGSMR